MRAVLVVLLLTLLPGSGRAALFLEIGGAGASADSSALPAGAAVIHGTAGGGGASVDVGPLCLAPPCDFSGNAGAELGGDGTFRTRARSEAGGDSGAGSIALQLTDTVVFRSEERRVGDERRL